MISFLFGVLFGIFIGWFAASWSIAEDFKALYKKKTGRDFE